MVSAPPKMGEPTWSRFDEASEPQACQHQGLGQYHLAVTSGNNLSFSLSHKVLLPTRWGRLSFPGRKQKALYTWACELDPCFHSGSASRFTSPPHTRCPEGLRSYLALRESKRPARCPLPWLVPLSSRVEGCWHPTGPPGSPQ